MQDNSCFSLFLVAVSNALAFAFDQLLPIHL